jgi:predicted alpha/beta-fold hydrolase
LFPLQFLRRSITKKAERQHVRFPGIFDIKKIRSCRSLGEFDEAFTCPIYGFKDREEYYRESGSKRWLHKIRVPTIAINARDDPFIDESSLPSAGDVLDAPVNLIYHSHGGHCGFISAYKHENEGHGWIAEEMGRALDHIYFMSKGVNWKASSLKLSAMAESVAGLSNATMVAL